MAFHHSRDSLFIATTENDYAQCAEAALNKDFWHNLCAANTPLSRSSVLAPAVGRHGATALLTKGHLSEGCVVDSPRLCLRTFVQTLTEPVSGTFPLPRAGYLIKA